MGRKRQLGRQVERAMDLPGGMLAGAVTIEIEGSHRAVIGGCRGIAAYTEECIRLRTPEGQVAFMGCGLEMGCLTEDGATVTGELQRIEFIRGEG